MNDLDDRFGIHAQVTAGAATASAYLVSAILVLFLLATDRGSSLPPYVKIADPARRAS